MTIPIKQFLLLLLVVGCFVSNAPAVFGFEIPGRTRYCVNDYAGVIDAQTKDYLENYLKAFKKRHKKLEFEVTTLSSIEGMSLDVFNREMVYKWRRMWPFPNEYRVHFLVIVDDHTARLNTHYALESILTPEVNQRIINDVVAPEFEKKRYSEGIKKGVESIVKILDERADNIKYNGFY